ncbi:MAG: CPBP family intramembrane metalloprotease [Deltaproteobacteria bacterium]|nr:MAG: CPBP family intramembrane metalloprotease [Deltaproteobacteria bacterium]
MGLSVLYLMNGDLFLGITRFLFWWGLISALFIALYIALLLPGEAGSGEEANVPLLVYRARWICFLIAFWFLISLAGNGYLIHLFWKMPFDPFSQARAALEFDYVIFPLFLGVILIYRYLKEGKLLPTFSRSMLNLNIYWGLRGFLYTIVFALGGGYLVIRLLRFLSLYLVIEENTYTPFFASAQTLEDYLLALFSAAVLAPVCEESFFRGVIFPGVRARHGEIKAILATALFFALFHLTIGGFPVLFLFGIILAHLYTKTGSLLAPIVTHSLYNLMLLVSVYLNTPKVT